MADELLVDRRGVTQWLTFNRPQVRNAITPSMYDGLADACDAVNADGTIRAVVITGAGGTFAAGADIAQFQDFHDERDVLAYEARVDRALHALEAVEVPTIAAMAGACTGAGAAIAAVCDLRIATASARFGFPIARTLGNCLSMANLARISALIGTSRLTDILLRARLLDAKEMAETGMLLEVVADAAALATRAQAIADEVATLAPLTLWATKEAMRRLRARSGTADEDRDLILACYLSRDFKEGVAAFLEKRKPVWTGE